jgi:2-keto-4-pentenoate hydratase
MYITTKREDSSSINSARNSRAFRLRLKQVIAIARWTTQHRFFLRHFFMAAKTPVFAAYFVLAAGCATTDHRVDEQIIDAWNQKQSLPLAHLVDETLTIDRAYEIQTRVVRKVLRARNPAGFKAGLTSRTSQERFRAPGPIAGVLIFDSAATPGELKLSELRGLHLETEVAMRIGRAIRKRVMNIDELKSHIDGIAPAVELPNLDYEQPQQLNALDIVASNVAAAHYLLGDFVSPSVRDANALTTTLECNGEQVNRGHASDAMGDQWEAARWLVNTVIENGWTLEPGQVLLTGALGKMIPAKPGHCVAQFSNWGQIAVRITQ